MSGVNHTEQRTVYIRAEEESTARVVWVKMRVRGDTARVKEKV